MRIAWTSLALLAGVGSAIALGAAPGEWLPVAAFWCFLIALFLIVGSLVVARRRAAIPLLLVVFLLGCWRGGDVATRIVEPENRAEYASEGSFHQARSFQSDNLHAALGGTQSGLPVALLTGNRSRLDDQVTQDFRSAGLAHLLAISGLHVSLVGGTAMALIVVLLGRRRLLYLLIPLALVFAYAALAGFAPPITRAAIMFSVFVLGRFMGRGSHTLAALALAGMLMVLWEPEILASLSFQLSFAAMLGIAYVAPVLDGFSEISAADKAGTLASKSLHRFKRFVIGSLIVSLAATLGTLPLIAMHFQSVPIWGPVATLVAVPAMPVLIYSSFALSVVGTLPILSDVAALPVSLTTLYLTNVASFFADLRPRPMRTDSWSVGTVCLYYVGLGALIAVWHYRKSLSEKFRETLIDSKLRESIASIDNVKLRIIATFALLLAGVAMWGASTTGAGSEPHLQVTFLQTSYGESILIQTPNGNRMLIDGGGEPDEVADALDSRLPMWDREIDVVMLTHPDGDHVGGLPAVLDRFDVATVLHNGVESSTDAYSAWSDAIEDQDDVRVVWPRMAISLDRDVVLDIISAGCETTASSCTATNNASIVAKLKHGDVSFLLTGDIEAAAELRLVNEVPDLRATVFKAPHHGSNTSSTSAFVSAVNPAAVVIASGTENTHGHPDDRVLARLIAAVGEDRVLRTDVLGTITLTTDGERLWMVR